MKNWDGGALKGIWAASLKIDGVCVIVKGGKIRSRKNKPLYNMDHLNLPDGMYEVFLGSWEATVSAVRASKQERAVERKHLYPLDITDSRLVVGEMIDPTERQLRIALKLAVKRGYEGLVLRQGKNFFKLKPKTTYDVKVTDVLMGNGKHKGKMGALMTPKGKVGTGFTDAVRAIRPVKGWIGKTIEVESMGLTPGGKFRHPRYLRTRFDK